MRFLVSKFFMLSLWASLNTLGFSAQAVAPENDEFITAVSSPVNVLDTLYERLRRTRDAARAATYAKEIDDSLDHSESATITLLLQWSDDAENEGRNASALDFLSEAIGLRPNDIAAYRKRAVVHYSHDDLSRAMDDIRTALSLEPRDFGALGLMATILDQTGQQEAAVAVWRRYLVFYPSDRDVRSYIDNIDNTLAGKRL